MTNKIVFNKFNPGSCLHLNWYIIRLVNTNLITAYVHITNTKNECKSMNRQTVEQIIFFTFYNNCHAKLSMHTRKSYTMKINTCIWTHLSLVTI